MGFFSIKTKNITGIIDRVGYTSTNSTHGYFFLKLVGDDTTYSLENDVSGTVFDGADIYRTPQRTLALSKAGDEVSFTVKEKNNSGKSSSFINKTIFIK